MSQVFPRVKNYRVLHVALLLRAGNLVLKFIRLDSVRSKLSKLAVFWHQVENVFVFFAPK